MEKSIFDRAIILNSQLGFWKGKLDKLHQCKHWFGLSISGEDGTERQYSMSISGTTDNKDEQLLLKEVYSCMEIFIQNQVDSYEGQIKSL